MKKLAIKTSVVLLAALLALTGCSSGSNPSDKSSEKSASEKILVVGRGGDTVTLDPAQSTEDESNRVTEEVVETLVTYKKGPPICLLCWPRAGRFHPISCR